MSWAVALLPFYEQGPLYNAVNYSYGAPQPQNQVTISTTKIATLICPSENFKTGPWIATNMANYRANFGGPGVIASWSGAFVVLSPNVNGQSGCACITNQNVGSFGTEGVTDGTSNTAAISEKLIGTSGYGNSSGASTITASNRNLALRGMFLPPNAPTINVDTGGPAGGQLALQFLPELQRHPRDPDALDL